ncbi:MAG: BspA family leucine-rich repeat surface protein [Bacteroidaceae bacterium]|nr:BspA family leucine-rich repeat surface protein [Bacteroidaceae bacterium]
MKKILFLFAAMLTLLSVQTVNAQTEYEYVDLGLPSGTLWATCNVGANSPEEFGDFFSWGETEPKSYYEYSTYKYCMGTHTTLTKYCTDSAYGYNGFTDDKTVLDPEDDAATVNMGDDWCTPSPDQMVELKQCTRQWTEQNGVGGILFTGPNGNKMFLPAAGMAWKDDPQYLLMGRYLSNECDKSFCPTARFLEFYYYYSDVSMGGSRREYGLPVRAVRVKDESEVYTDFVESTGTLTYYYDKWRTHRSGVTELYDPINAPDAVRFKDYYNKVTKVVIDPSMKKAPLTSFRNMSYGGFDSGTLTAYDLENVTSFQGLENLNTSIVTDMNSMFVMCSSLTSLDLSSFNTSNVTSMSGMFLGCNKLVEVDLTSFDVSNVTDMKTMFGSCSNLTTIYCNKDWSKGISHDNSYLMFSGCKKLVGGNGTTFDSNVTDATYARPDGGKKAPGYFTNRLYAKGDVDHNGVVNSADVVAIYNFILSGEAETGISKEAADVDDNGSVNSGDVVAVYNIIIGA